MMYFIILTRNNPEYLIQCLESLKKQTDQNFKATIILKQLVMILKVVSSDRNRLDLSLILILIFYLRLILFKILNQDFIDLMSVHLQSFYRLNYNLITRA